MEFGLDDVWYVLYIDCLQYSHIHHTSQNPGFMLGSKDLLRGRSHLAERFLQRLGHHNRRRFGLLHRQGRTTHIFGVLMKVDGWSIWRDVWCFELCYFFKAWNLVPLMLRALGLEYHVPPGAFRLRPEEHWWGLCCAGYLCSSGGGIGGLVLRCSAVNGNKSWCLLDGNGWS